MPYRMFTYILIVFGSLLIGEHYYQQYKQLNESGGEIRILDRVIYSVPSKVKQKLSIHAPPDTYISTNNQPVLSSNSHCPPRFDKPIQYNRKDKIFTWKNEHGRKIITNQPEQKLTSRIEINDLKINEFDLPDLYFNLNIEYKYVGSTYQLRNKLENSLRNVYRVVSSILGKERLRLSTVNLKIFSGKDSFHKFRKSVASGTNENTDGFYQHGKGINLAATYAHQNFNDTVSVSLHESFHVLAHEIFTDTPTWFNEGMAEYFETMTIKNDVSTIHSQPSWSNILRQNSKMPLNHLITMKPNDFYSNNHSQTTLHYASAWSLISYLMQHLEGRQFLKIYMQTMYDNYCLDTPTLQLITQYYPGGSKVLEKNWHQWISRSSQFTQTWEFNKG